MSALALITMLAIHARARALLRSACNGNSAIADRIVEHQSFHFLFLGGPINKFIALNSRNTWYRQDRYRM